MKIGGWMMKRDQTHLPEEPCDNVSEYDGFVGFVVIWWGRDTSKVPKISLPLVHPGCQCLSTVREMVGFISYDKDMDDGWTVISEKNVPVVT
jgi:hypothetical protein